MADNRVPHHRGNARGINGEAASCVCAKIRPGLFELLEAWQYARLLDRDVWDFAVEIRRLRDAGLSTSDFRWLTCMNYVQHAREVTKLDENGRQFHPTGNLSFSKRTCFVLTASGAEWAQSLLATRAEKQGTDAPDPVAADRVLSPGSKEAKAVPCWDAERHELRVNGTLVKQFKWAAANQEMVLVAFEEEGWPARIDDPLPPQPEQDSKRRLHDTIKGLNKNQRNHLLHFRGDGTGEGVLWEFRWP